MGELKQRPGDQPLPIPNDEPDIQSQVIADIEARRELGIKRYGSALQPFNGRDALRDAYEESLDQTMYLKQALVEQAHPDPGFAVLREQIDDAMHGHLCPDCHLPRALDAVMDVIRQQAREDLKAGGRAELLDTLLALRAQWDRRRTERAVHRDHPEAAIARAASVEHNAYSRILAELDQALNALEHQ